MLSTTKQKLLKLGGLKLEAMSRDPRFNQCLFRSLSITEGIE